jgi:hypothetical protein
LVGPKISRITMRITTISSIPILPNIGTSNLVYLLRPRPSHVNQATCNRHDRFSFLLGTPYTRYPIQFRPKSIALVLKIYPPRVNL